MSLSNSLLFCLSQSLGWAHSLCRPHGGFTGRNLCQPKFPEDKAAGAGFWPCLNYVLGGGDVNVYKSSLVLLEEVVCYDQCILLAKLYPPCHVLIVKRSECVGIMIKSLWMTVLVR